MMKMMDDKELEKVNGGAWNIPSGDNSILNQDDSNNIAKKNQMGQFAGTNEKLNNSTLLKSGGSLKA